MLTLLLTYGIATPAQPPETFAAEAVGRGHPRGHRTPDHRLLRVPVRPQGPFGWRPGPHACAMTARKNDKRSDRLEWEHVVPASWFGKSQRCWTQGDSLCVKTDGTGYAGRRCCTSAASTLRSWRRTTTCTTCYLLGRAQRRPAESPLRDGGRGAPGLRSVRLRGGRTPEGRGAAGERPRRARARHALHVGALRLDVRMSREALLEWHQADPPNPGNGSGRVASKRRLAG